MFFIQKLYIKLIICNQKKIPLTMFDLVVSTIFLFLYYYFTLAIFYSEAILLLGNINDKLLPVCSYYCNVYQLCSFIY